MAPNAQRPQRVEAPNEIGKPRTAGEEIALNIRGEVGGVLTRIGKWAGRKLQLAALPLSVGILGGAATDTTIDYWAGYEHGPKIGIVTPKYPKGSWQESLQKKYDTVAKWADHTINGENAEEARSIMEKAKEELRNSWKHWLVEKAHPWTFWVPFLAFAYATLRLERKYTKWLQKWRKLRGEPADPEAAKREKELERLGRENQALRAQVGKSQAATPDGPAPEALISAIGRHVGSIVPSSPAEADDDPFNNIF